MTALVVVLVVAAVAAQAQAASSVIDNFAALNYQDDSGQQQPPVISNVARVFVDVVVNAAAVEVTPTYASDSGAPGEVVYYAVSVASVGNVTDTFSLQVASQAVPPWSVAVLADDGAGAGIPGDGSHQPGETNRADGTDTLAPSAVFHCFVAVSIPPDAEDGASDVAALSAISQSDPTQSAAASFRTSVIAAPLKGYVRDRAAGQPLIGATVNVYLDQTWVDSTLTAAPDGRYQFGREFLPGTYRVSASYRGYATQTNSDVAITDGGTTRADFGLDRAALLIGEVRDRFTGAPIIGATMEVFMDGALVGQTVSRAPNGAYELTLEVPAGECLVTASAPDYVGHRRIHAYVAPGLTTVVDFFFSSWFFFLVPPNWGEPW